MAHADLGLLRADLLAVADPGKAEQMAAYMKGHFVFLGVTAGDRRNATKELTKAARTMQPDDLVELATACWAEPEREFHYVGMDVLRAGANHLRASDLAAVRGFILATPWWDTVDSLAAWTVGTMVSNHPELARSMDDWIEDDDIWIARTAILHQLGYKEITDAPRLFRYAERRASHSDFFIRKAIGWALRQYARVDPEAVELFVAEHDAELSGLTKREALKHIG